MTSTAETIKQWKISLTFCIFFFFHLHVVRNLPWLPLSTRIALKEIKSSSFFKYRDLSLQTEEMTQRRTKNQHWKHFLCEEEPSLSNLSRLHSIQTLNVPLSCIKYSQNVWYCQLCLVKQILVFLVLLFKSKQLIRLAYQGDNEGIMALHARLP